MRGRCRQRTPRTRLVTYRSPVSHKRSFARARPITGRRTIADPGFVLRTRSHSKAGRTPARPVQRHRYLTLGRQLPTAASCFGCSSRPLEAVDGPLDLVTAPVSVRVEAGRSSTRAALPSTMGASVLRLRAGALDVAPSQVAAVSAGAVCLVTADVVGPGPGPSAQRAGTRIRSRTSIVCGASSFFRDPRCGLAGCGRVLVGPAGERPLAIPHPRPMTEPTSARSESRMIHRAVPKGCPV